MNTTHRGTFIRALVVALAMAAGLLGAGPAQAQAHPFKVGDRVEVDTFMRGSYAGADKYATWRKGTVTGFFSPEQPFGGYVVKVDEDGREMQIRFTNTQWIRAPQGPDTAAAPQAGGGERGQPVATEAGKPAAVSCPATDDLAGSSQAATFKRAIDHRYESNGKSLDQTPVPVTIHFSAFKIGSSHSYSRMVNNPDGPGGVAGGAVYPVKTSYTVCVDYPGFAATGFKGELLKTEYEDMTYACFKDDTGDWICNQSGGRQGMPQHVPK